MSSLKALILLSLSALVSSDLRFGVTLSDLNLPDGFSIERYIAADTISKPRVFALGMYNGSTVVFVGTTSTRVYALIDYDSDGTNDAVYNIWTNPSSSCGRNNAKSIAVDNTNGDLYITAYCRTYKCPNVYETLFTSSNNQISCSLWLTTRDFTWHGDRATTWDYENGRLCMEFGVACNYECLRTNFPESNIVCYKDMENPSTDANDLQIQAQGTLVLYIHHIQRENMETFLISEKSKISSILH